MFDRVEKTTHEFSIDDSKYINILNSVDSIGIGTIINKIYNKDEDDLCKMNSQTHMETPVIDSFNELELSSSDSEDGSSEDSEYEYSKYYK